MKIAVDARELASKPTGVGRYLFELLREWANNPDALQHTWALYSAQALTVPDAFQKAVRVLSGGGSGTKWEQWTLARTIGTDRPDVLFAPGYTAPLASTSPVVLTIHDVSFFAHPEWFTFREGARRRTLTRLSASRARLVLTDSEFSRGEIVRHLGLDATTVRVIRLGVRAPTTGMNVDGLPREPLLLFVGSIFRRRHVDTLIEAFAAYVAPHVRNSRLEIIGDNRAYPPVDLERLLWRQSPDIQRRISVRSYVSDQTLADLYARASVFVFPSEYEGFGLTPLEALAAGVPSIVLKTPIASEIYGPAARYVEHVEPLGARLGEAIIELLTSPTARAELLQHRVTVLDRYRWSDTARQTLTALEETARA
jgi:glycosyltransferase involved in cell wall biosynthesis